MMSRIFTHMCNSKICYLARPYCEMWVYHIGLGEQEVITEVPKKLLDIEAKLGLDIFPIIMRS